MDSTRVAAAQATDLADRIAPMLGYCTRLAERMQQRGWAGSDPLYADVRAAQDALHRLHLTLRELARLQRASVAGAATVGAGR